MINILISVKDKFITILYIPKFTITNDRYNRYQISNKYQINRAVTSAATFSVAPGLAPLLFKIDSAATSVAGILTTFKRCANR